MANRFRVSKVLVRRLEELGVGAQAVLRQAGLPASLFEQEKVMVTTEELFAFYRGIEEVSGDEAIGLRIGTEERVERYDPISIAAVHARSFRDALGRMARYKQLTCPEEIRVTERGEECEVVFRWLLAAEREPEMLTDLCFAWTLGIARRGTGRAISPKRVEFRRQEKQREMYETHFGCGVKFGAEENALVFERRDVDRPFVTHNADLLAIIAPQLDAELKQHLEERSLGEQVKGIVKRLLAGQRPALEMVARELRMSTRTLQRRLTGEGSSFQQVVEEARRELAQHYLLHSTLELNQTAYLLGYEDANSFFRAFHGWEGTSPGAWRHAHLRLEEVPEAEGQPA